MLLLVGDEGWMLCGQRALIVYADRSQVVQSQTRAPYLAAEYSIQHALPSHYRHGHWCAKSWNRSITNAACGMDFALPRYQQSAKLAVWASYVLVCIESYCSQSFHRIDVKDRFRRQLSLQRAMLRNAPRACTFFLSASRIVLVDLQSSPSCCG